VTRLQIEDRIAEAYPDVRVAGCAATGIDRAAAGLVVPDVASVAEDLAAIGATIEQLASHPRVAPWREATGRAGLKPSTYRSSPEALARRFLKGAGVTTGLPVVDAYCALSARHLAPLGAYDVDCLPPGAPIDLRHGRPGDAFAPIGAGDVPLSESVAVYAAGATILCWDFNHRDSRDTCLEAGTTTALFLGEAVHPDQHDALDAALADLAELLAGAGATVGPIRVATAVAPRVEIEPG